MIMERQYTQWIEDNPKLKNYNNHLKNLIEIIEKKSKQAIYKVNLYKYFKYICEYTNDAVFEIPARLFHYLNEFQIYLFETEPSLDVTVSLSFSKTKDRRELIKDYAQHYEQFVVYDIKSLIDEMIKKTQYQIDDEIIAVTQEEINQAVIYLHFYGFTLEEIFTLKISDIHIANTQIKIKKNNKNRYIVETNKYINKLFKKLVFTRWFAHIMKKTGRVQYIQMEGDFLIMPFYRIKKEKCSFDDFSSNYGLYQLKTTYLSRITLCGKVANAVEKNILGCKNKLISIDDAYQLISKISGYTVRDLKLYRSMYYYIYTLYKIIFQKNVN